jgi:hypothetical protein
MSASRPIYVETFIRADVARVIAATQQPQQHGRWDLRFSEITYLPSAAGADQRFSYATRIGFGRTIRGFGETTGERRGEDGSYVSGLRFWSDDQLSLIRAGSGYWRYEPRDGGTRFLTLYDYQPRFGPFGRIIDRLLFRPMLGWATAWSFDALRLWLERDIAPERSRRRGVVFALGAAAARIAPADFPSAARCRRAA